MSFSPIFDNGSISDSVFSIHSAIDSTRRAVYNLSAIGPGITRTITIPNFDVNFSDIYAHAARHLPSGADPIATGTPVDIGVANAPGVANSLIRSDHVHKGLHSIASNADPQRFGDVKLINGAGITVTDDGLGNYTIAATSSGGTVTSVAMTVPAFLSVAGSPITSSGTLAVSLATQAANIVFAGPAAGGAVAPTFRSLVMADFPTATAVTISSDANAAGVSASLAKADHTHQLTATAALLNQIPKYDGTNWQALYPEELLSPGNAFSFTEEFLTLQNTTIGGQLNNNAFMGINTWLQKSAGANSGVTMSTTRVDANHPGVIDVIAGAGAGNYCDVLLPGIVMVGGGILTYEVLLYVTTLSTVTNEYTIRVGLGDTVNASDNANGIYFEYTRTTSVNWLMKAAKTSTVTSTASGTAVTAGAWTKLKFVVNAAASSVDYFVNGTNVGTVTTNLPTSVIVGLFLQQTRSAGTPVLFSVDYVNMYQRFTTAR